MTELDVSVCICTYNRQESLLEVLQSLKRVHVPKATGWEVLVIDNNSSDGTAEAVQSGEWEALPLRYVHEPRQGLSHARNAAVSKAEGRVLAFLDDDVAVETDWLEKLLGAFGAEPAPAVVGGPAILDSELERPAWWHGEFDGPAGHFDAGDSVRTSDDGYGGMIGIGANMAFHRSVFERYGHFRTDLGRTGSSLAMGEELELLDRLRRGDERLVYDPSVVVYHRPDLARVSRSYLRRWYFRFGEWQFENERDSDVVRLLGLPRWRFRHLAELVAKWLGGVFTRRRPEAFLHQVHLVAFGGYVKRAWSRNRSEPQGRESA
ncbi:MAG: glycosyltransferase family 2 protein [Gemmatimonadetes bacterium]|nr:glycosyltransferase [Gemmatimonadota bacterium]NNF13910.1 glycosyltransferase family 2 protein [Gemmatimonadota bacterium]